MDKPSLDKTASRYGPPPKPARTRRRVTMLLAGLVIAATLGAAALAYQRYERADVEGEAAAFRVLDDRTVSVTISVTRTDPSRTVVCIVRARSQDGAETGRRELVVGPAQANTIQVQTTVASFRKPYVGDVYGCGTDVPGYLAR